MSITRKTRWAARSNYGASRKASEVKYIVLHYTGNDGDTDEANASYFANNEDLRASAHFFVDDDSITQSVPELNVAYSVGGKKYGDCSTTGGGKFYGKCTNANSISVEMCDTKRDGKIMASEQTQANAAMLVAELMERFNVPFDRVIRHFDVNGKHCPAYFMEEAAWNAWKRRLRNGESATTTKNVKSIQASDLRSMSNEAIINLVGPLCTADQEATGVLASVTMAQFILESAYGKSQLAQAANNCFGMKTNLSGNNWAGSKWDGISIYTKETQEQRENGDFYTISAHFRAYPNIACSIADHSAYLLGAQNGNKPRYDGLKGCTDYRKAAQIIKDGGYATSLTYVDKLCRVVEEWNLTRFDYKATTEKVSTPYLVRVSISDLNIRIGPGVSYRRVKYIPKGIYTIVEEKDGWGRLKSGAGWIKLKYTTKQ